MCVRAYETLFTAQKSLFFLSGSTPDSPLDVDTESLRHRKRDADCSFIMGTLNKKRDAVCVCACAEGVCDSRFGAGAACPKRHLDGRNEGSRELLKNRPS